MPFTDFADSKIMSSLFLGATLGQPSTWYLGLIGATTWLPGHTYQANSYVVPTNFNALPRQPGAIWTLTGGAGTASGGTEPSWTATAGDSVSDSGITWTEVTNLFEQGTFTGAELSGNGYARQPVATGSTTWAVLASGPPTVVQNAASISFVAATANWSQAVAFLLADALPTATNPHIWGWGTLDSVVTVSSGNVPYFPVNALTLSLE